MSGRHHEHRILILDDDPLVLDFLTEFLKRKGHVVAGILTPDKIESAVTEYKCDAAVVDIRLKGDDGLQYIPKIRNLMPTGAPVVVFTALGYKEEEMQRALKMGARGFVSKLLPPEDLYAALISAFGSKA